MDEVVLIPRCDLCTDRTPATIRAVVGVSVIAVEAGPDHSSVLPRPDLMVVDLCEHHAAEAAAVDLLAGHGRALSRRMSPPTLTASGSRVGRKPGPRGGQSFVPAPCPACGNGLWGSRSLVRHLQQVHQWKTPPTPKRCPDCGWRPTANGADPTRAMHKHRGQAHGWRMAEAMIEVNQ